MILLVEISQNNKTQQYASTKLWKLCIHMYSKNKKVFRKTSKNDGQIRVSNIFRQGHMILKFINSCILDFALAELIAKHIYNEKLTLLLRKLGKKKSRSD